MGDKNNLLLFFDRPTEPCFMQKGESKTVFEVPDHYYPDKYKGVSERLSDRFGNDAGRSIPVRNIALPDLSLPMELAYQEQFSMFVPKHRKMAAKLIDIFMGMRDVEDLQSICAYCQLRINPYLFNYCLSVAILHRPDTKGLNLPTYAETFPDKFMDPKVFRRARETATVEPSGSRMPIVIPQNYTASDAEPEQSVAYWREDIGINLHHWHWHLVYPPEAADRALVDKDRRGELWYYMHQQTIARYNIERMCNNLSRVNSFSNFRAPIAEGYFSKLDSQVASRNWPPRFAGSTIKDLDRPADTIKIEVRELETWRDRLVQAIENLSVILPNGKTVPLTEETGIDVLANILESSILSINRPYYGDLHGMGHVIISYAHDPDHRHLEQFGVMGDFATTMRDPAFFLWHSYIDDIFYSYKIKLTPYTNNQLVFPGIQVTSVGVEGRGGNNTFATLWEQSTINLGRGLDFTPRGPVLARFTHLQHEPFNYVIECNNTTGQGAMATVRIFMAPTADEKGQAYNFEQQRRFWIELDKFSQNLRPGKNTIRRSSADSSVTIPFERTFANQEARPGTAGSAQAAEFDFCVCGWPDHLLVPKGTPQGYPMVLFAMMSNWMEDRKVTHLGPSSAAAGLPPVLFKMMDNWQKVDIPVSLATLQGIKAVKVEQDLVGVCNDAASYCGLRDRRYPDRRSMGYPFDRPAQANVNNINDFLTPNMTISDCTVRFQDTTRQRGQTS